MWMILIGQLVLSFLVEDVVSPYPDWNFGCCWYIDFNIYICQTKACTILPETKKTKQKLRLFNNFAWWGKIVKNKPANESTMVLSACQKFWLQTI